MFLENDGFWGRLLRTAHLYGIPKVSEWLGARLWARIIAWWVFPVMILASSCVGMMYASSALIIAAERFSQGAEPGLAFGLGLAGFVFAVVVLAVEALSPVLLMLLYVAPVCCGAGSPGSGSLLSVFDPDQFLEVPYRLSAK